MRVKYFLKPNVAGEPEPVSLLLDIWFDGRSATEFTILVQGARLLKPRIGVDPADGRIVMRAGAEFGQLTGVRLSNGFNVVDPVEWRCQGIGTVAMNHMIMWAQQHHRTAKVRPVELRRYGRWIRDDDPRLTFYRRFNLHWDPADQSGDAAYWASCPATVAELEVAPLPSNIWAVA